jgi:ATP-dependent DNA helicase DinG
MSALPYSAPMIGPALPEVPAVVAGHGRASILTTDGELLVLAAEEAARRLTALSPPLLVHAPATLRRLGLRAMPCYDLLELFAFALPARSAAPTPRGLCLALDLDPPGSGIEGEAAILPEIAATLLRRLMAGRNTALNRDAAGLAQRMGQAGWGWARFVAACLGRPGAPPSGEGLKVWKRITEWEETPAPPPPA